MRRLMAALLVLGLLAAGGMLAYLTVLREQDYRDRLARGDAALRSGESFGAIEEYSGAIALRPDSMLARLRRGEAYQQRNEFDAAARDFRDAAALDPSATRPLDALGDVEYQRQWFNRAADIYEARLRLDDRSALVWYKLALARHRAGNLDAALTALSESIRLEGDFADAHYLLGVSLRERGRVTEAVKAFETAVSLAPARLPAREELAESYGLLGRRADELEQLQAIAGLDRAQTSRQVHISLAHARAGHGELAVLMLGNALERTPNQPSVYAALGRVWLEMADTRVDALSKALEALEQVASDPGATSEALGLYGRALIKANQPEAAERVLQQAASRFPIDPAVLPRYADVAEQLGHHEAARGALVHYQALVPAGNTLARDAARIARLSMRLNQPVAAALWFQRAAGASPGDMSLMAQLADAQLRAGAREAAKATIDAALAREPGNETFLALSRRF